MTSRISGTWQESIASLARNRTHGATEITLRAAETLLRGSEKTDKSTPLRESIRYLIRGQRCMAPVWRLACDLWNPAETNDIMRFRKICRRWIVDLKSAKEKFSNELLADPPRAETWYVLSRSSIISQGVSALAERGITGRVLVGESRPGGEGIRTAEVFAKAGWKTELLPDSVLFDRVLKREGNMLVLGCDALDGRGFINKSGSGAIAYMSKQQGIVVELWTTTHKILPRGLLTVIESDGPQGSDLEQPIPLVNTNQPLFGTGRLKDIDSVRSEKGRLNIREVSSLASGLSEPPLELLQEITGNRGRY